MLRLSRLAALVGLLVAFFGIASAQPPAGTAFTWDTYTGTDGKKYVFPNWSTNADNTVSLSVASGTLDVGAKYTATSAKMRVEVPGPLKGSWVISFEHDPADLTAKDKTFNFHILSGRDTNMPKKTFAAGSDVRFSWIVTLEDANKAKTTVTFGPYELKAANKLAKDPGKE